MADICIVYARENADIAKKIYDHLSKQWDVWWDENIVGEFDREIEKEIENTSCLLPIFSQHARQKSTFTDELRLGRKHLKSIIPVRVDESDAPYSFGSLSCVDIRNWDGEVTHPDFTTLLKKLTIVVKPREIPKRPTSVEHGKIKLPNLFLSVSSYDTQLLPTDAVRALRLFNVPSILISAYDLVASRNPEDMIKEVKKYRKNGGFVLIDSGNYEASRLGDESWRPEHLAEVLSSVPHDWAFCYDEMNPKLGSSDIIREIVASVNRDQASTSARVLPIVHAPKLKRGAYATAKLPKMVRDLAEQLSPPMIGIPERELGAGLIARAKSVTSIREELSDLPFYQPIHLLGTGNPWSLPILALAGADSFDGLEWCRMVVDRQSNRLNHFQHFDFFSYQSEVANSAITKEALHSDSIDYAGKVAFHNLDYFSYFVREVQQYISEGNTEALSTWLVGKDATTQLKRELPGLFK